MPVLRCAFYNYADIYNNMHSFINAICLNLIKKEKDEIEISSWKNK